MVIGRIPDAKTTEASALPPAPRRRLRSLMTRSALRRQRPHVRIVPGAWLNHADPGDEMEQNACDSYASPAVEVPMSQAARDASGLREGPCSGPSRRSKWSLLRVSV